MITIRNQLKYFIRFLFIHIAIKLIGEQSLFTIRHTSTTNRQIQKKKNSYKDWKETVSKPLNHNLIHIINKK